MSIRLFHFSDDGTIPLFQPHPARVPVERPDGLDWLNGSLVWAIDEWHQPMYLFPRECPRILLWREENTIDRDAKKYFGISKARMLAYIEQGWETILEEEIIYRYELPCHTFTSLNDAGMWVSDKSVHPTEKLAYSELPKRLLENEVELRVIPHLNVLKDAWDSSLHVSGIRLRNAQQWN